MQTTTKFILGFSFLIASMTVSGFSFKSSDFGMDDDDYDDSWGSGPMSWSSGKWNTGPWGGGPFNTDTRNWGFSPWNRGGRKNYWGGRNNPWGYRNWGGNREPWNRGYGYGNPYQRAPYGGWYGYPYPNPYPYNPGPWPLPAMPDSPQIPSTPGVDNKGKQ